MHSRYSEIPQVTEALAEAGGRVQAIAFLHERLYASGSLAELNVGEYLRDLANTLHSLHSRPEITLDIETADIVLDIGRATSLALIANELILNCFKHAFGTGQVGRVSIVLRYEIGIGQSEADAMLGYLEVKDNGVGFDSGVDPEKPTSMGLEIVRLLSRQLRAQGECSRQNGVTWRLIFPLAR